MSHYVTLTPQHRITSLDTTKGFVLILIFFQGLLVSIDPNYTLEYQTLTLSPLLYFVGWLLQSATVILIFLIGISVYLSSRKYTQHRVFFRLMIQRALILLLLELTVSNYLSNQNLFVIELGIFWILAIGLLSLAFISRLSKRFQLSVLCGLILIQFYSIYAINHDPKSALTLLAFTQIIDFGHGIRLSNPFTPWAWMVVLITGYMIGATFMAPSRIRKELLLLSAALFISLFIILRGINHLGNPDPWLVDSRGFIYSLMSFLNVHSNTPSIADMLICIGIGLLLLAYFENIRGRITRFLGTFGRAPILFLSLHFVSLRAIDYANTKHSPLSTILSSSYADYIQASLSLILLLPLVYFCCVWYRKKINIMNKVW